MKYKLIIILLMCRTLVFAQDFNKIEINGFVLSQIDKKPCVNARVFIDNTYYETITNKDGGYQLTLDLNTLEKEEDLKISVIYFYGEEIYSNTQIIYHDGTKDYMQVNFYLDLPSSIQDIKLSAQMKNKNKEVTIKRDDVLIFSSQSDISSSINENSLSTQKNNSTGQFYFRGGQGSETKVFLDEILYPNYLGASSVGSASRFTYPALLIKQTDVFINGWGGYFGDALSGVINIKTDDELPYTSDLNLITSLNYNDITYKLRTSNSSINFHVDHTNLSVYELIRSKTRMTEGFEKPYYNTNILLNLLSKSSNGSTFKGNMVFTRGGYEYFFVNPLNGKVSIEQKASSIYGNFVMKSNKIYGGFSIGNSYNKNIFSNEIKSGDSLLTENGAVINAKIYYFSKYKDKVQYKIGNDILSYFNYTNTNDQHRNKTLFNPFVNIEVNHFRNLLVNFSLRGVVDISDNKKYFQYSFLSQYSLKNKHLFSLDIGNYYTFNQNYSKLYPELGNVKSYNLGYTYNSSDLKIVMNAYSKNYSNTLNEFNNRKGDIDGYAKGFEVGIYEKFLKYLRLKLLYSFVDSKRMYLSNYYQPSYIASHNFILGLSKKIDNPDLILSMNGLYASGKPIYLSDSFLKDYFSINLGVNYFFNVKNYFMGVIVRVENLLGNRNQLGYDHNFDRINYPQYQTNYFLGIYLNIGVNNKERIKKMFN